MAPRVFSFDHSFWSHNPADTTFVTQDEVFNKLGPDILNDVFEGYNSCVFAYGQTGAGKSYTMMGGPGDDRGLTPRLCEDLFTRIDLMKASGQTEQDTFDWSATVEVPAANCSALQYLISPGCVATHCCPAEHTAVWSTVTYEQTLRVAQLCFPTHSYLTAAHGSASG